MTPKLLLAAAILALPLAAQAGSLQLFTEYTPPDIMRDGQRIIGISPDKVKEVMGRAGIIYSVAITGWKRGHDSAHG